MPTCLELIKSGEVYIYIGAINLHYREQIYGQFCL